jgi:mannose-6-phosphate isomerase-like protein (cupin superfamily)
MKPSCKVIRCEDYRWDGIEGQPHVRDGDIRGVSQHVLFGEAEGEEHLTFVTRYFEIEPGGCSSLEWQHHPRVVVVVRGQGRVVLQDRIEEIRPFDAVHVAPDCLHQFRASDTEPLGFLCIVARERDAGGPAIREESAAVHGPREAARAA